MKIQKCGQCGGSGVEWELTESPEVVMVRRSFFMSYYDITVFHKIKEEGENTVISVCGRSGYTDREYASDMVRMSAEKAVENGLRPCMDCFGDLEVLEDG